MLTSNCFSTKISVCLYQNGWQISCHLIIGRNVKDFELEFSPYIVLVKNKCKSIANMMAVQLPPNYR